MSPTDKQAQLPHHKLIAYELALELVQLVARTRISEAQLRAQARKSAASAALNTAEGAARQTLADKSRAYAIALAECCECCAAVEIAGALGAPAHRATCRPWLSWARASKTCSAGSCAEPRDSAPPRVAAMRGAATQAMPLLGYELDERANDAVELVMHGRILSDVAGDHRDLQTS